MSEEKPKTKQEILDEAQARIMKSYYRRNSGLGKVWQKFSALLGRFKVHVVRIFYITVVLFVLKLIYGAIIAPPQYTDEETARSEKFVYGLVESNAGEVAPLFLEALDELKMYSPYYRQVINNIDQIKIGRSCPYACIYYQSYSPAFSIEFLPEANFNEKILVINPRGIRQGFNSPSNFASMLVHETNHVEYLESPKLRRALLQVDCSPILNPNISVFSTLPSITHRVKTMEVCAEKAQIKFHNASDTSSGYASNRGLLVGFFKIVGSIFSGMYRMLRSFF